MTDDASIDPITGKRKKYRLTKIWLDEISLCDSPADPQAVVTIWKRAPMANNSEAERRAEVDAALAKAIAEGGDAAVLQKARDAMAALRLARIRAEASMNFVSDDSLRKTREGAIRTATAAAVELERRRLAAAGDGGGEVSAAELEKRQRAAEEEVVGYERHRLEKRQKDRETVLAAIRKEQERADALTAAAKNHMAKNPNAGSPPGARRGRNSDGGRETSMDIPGLLSAEDRAALAEIRKARGAAADPQAAALGAIERIAKRYQDKHGGTFDAAVLEVSKTDPLVGQLHNIYRGREEIEDVEVLLKSLNAIARD